MLDLNDFRYFVRIVECGGLTAASRHLNVPKSTVSHRLRQLETSLGVRLINRLRSTTTPSINAPLPQRLIRWGLIKECRGMVAPGCH
ncbi:helix-turn-helix domain-containing protein [Variovorax sp. LjRoot175]|uniref:helix-turn-helix domain-containing protein n=1 Tax=Variovorax sp. LjRoot175 TaxID=3342276 RepID=UPI003F514BDB